AALLLGGDARPLRWSRRLGPGVAAVVVLVSLGLALGGLGERPSAAELSAHGPARLTSASSNRYEYWRVGLQALADHPLRGVGAGGFRVYWLGHRVITEAVRNAHSLEVETAAELGLAGLLVLALWIGGVAVSARHALRADRMLGAGWVAALLAWFLHAS